MHKYLHISKKSSTFATDLGMLNDGQTTVKRRSSDSQGLRYAPVAPEKHPKFTCDILYYIFIYNILFKPIFYVKTYTSVRAWKYNSLIYEYKQSHPFEQ